MRTPVPALPALTVLRAWLLAALLLAAQASGLAHRYVHAPAPLGDGARAAVAGQPHAAGSVDCRLIDHLALADLLCAAPLLAAVAPQSDAAAVVPAPLAPQLRPAAAYRARAPPRC